MLIKQVRPLVIFGGAVGDVVVTVNHLPCSGEDIAAQFQTEQIGGCAFNVLRVLIKQGLQVVNAIPIGCGTWGERVKKAMSELGSQSVLTHLSLDNGWCLALVEPDGERTFISLEGCETDWDSVDLSALVIPHNSIVYVSGYELAGQRNSQLADYLLNLPTDCTRFIDFGPRISTLSPALIDQMLGKNCIITANRHELPFLLNSPIVQTDEQLIVALQTRAEQTQSSIIARLSAAGVWLCQPQHPPHFIAAYPAQLVDTLGAGDSHSGGVLCGLARNATLAQAVDRGNQIAAWVVARRGAANPPTAEEIDREFKKSN